MAIRFIDGFDHFVIGDITKKWSFLVGPEGGGGTMVLDTGRVYGNSLKIGCTGGAFGRGVGVTLPASTANVIVGCAVKVASFAGLDDGSLIRRTLISCYDSAGAAAHGAVFLNLDGTITIGRRTVGGSTALATGSAPGVTDGAWFYLEYKLYVHDTLGTMEVHVNGNQVAALTLANCDSREGSGTDVSSVVLWGYPGYTDMRGVYTVWLDDVYVGDGATTFQGDVRARTLVVNGAGSNTMGTPSAGANYQCVDEVPGNGDTDYVTLAAVNDKDTYAVEDVTVGTAIKAIQIVAEARKDVQGTAAITGVTRIGGVDRDHDTPVGFSEDYSFQRFMYETNPATGAAWTAEELNAAEFGIKKTA